MRIGIDARGIENKPTGVGRVLLSLLKEWDSFDLPETKFVLYSKKQIPNLNLSERFQTKILDSKSNAWFTHWRLPRAAKKDEIDILFCPGYVAPLFYRGALALELHDIIYQARPDLYNWPSVWDRILLKFVSRRVAKKAKVILTCSEFSRKEILKHYRVAPEKVFNIPLAADKSFYPVRDAAKIRQVKEKYQIKDKFVFYIGSIFKRRHLPEAMLAFEKTEAGAGEIQFLIAGKDYSGQNINDLSKKINGRLGRKAIIRRDYLDGEDLTAVYSAADLTIYLSDYEGFGLPVLESIACGTPVITSRAASIPEVASQAAIYIENNSDVGEIAAAMTRGLDDQNLRQELIEKGLVRARQFSWQKTARQTLDALLNKG